MLDPIRARAVSAGIFLDLDGTLSPIASHPQHARVVDGVAAVLDGLAERYAAVVIVTGRLAQQAADMLGASRVRYEGVYGTESSTAPIDPEVRAKVEGAAAVAPEAWVEDKGVSITIHFRQSADPAAARADLVRALSPIAVAAGLEVVDGKATIELVRPGGARKGIAVRRIVEELSLNAAMFAGDDLADLDAFEALDDLSREGVATVKVAIRGSETPAELIEAADVVAESPEAFVGILRTL